MNTATAIATLKLSMCAGLAATAAGCAMDPPGPSPIYSRLPNTPVQQQQALTPQQQMDRYNAIDKQALAESQKAAQMGNDAKMMSNYYTPQPVSIYGGYSSGGWGYPGWGSGWSVGTGYAW